MSSNDGIFYQKSFCADKVNYNHITHKHFSFENAEKRSVEVKMALRLDFSQRFFLSQGGNSVLQVLSLCSKKNRFMVRRDNHFQHILMACLEMNTIIPGHNK